MRRRAQRGRERPLRRWWAGALLAAVALSAAAAAADRPGSLAAAQQLVEESEAGISVTLGTEEVEEYGLELGKAAPAPGARQAGDHATPTAKGSVRYINDYGHDKEKRELLPAERADLRSSDGCPADCGMVRDAFASGQCVNGACKCLPGWGGDTCTTPLGQPPIAGDPACDMRCGSGVFWAVGMCNSETGQCECAEGWSGPFCGFNNNYPLAKGLEHVNVIGVELDRNNGGQPTNTNTNPINPTYNPDTSNGCPYYAVASGLPLMCGPQNGFKRCPAGLCCSTWGYCGGGSLIKVKSFALDRSAPAHLYERGREEELERWEYERHLLAERSYCYGARALDGSRFREVHFEFEAEEHAMPRVQRRSIRRNCAKRSLEERTNSCKRTNECCSQPICKRMSIEERNNACSKRNNGGGCCPLPPCPPTPPQAYCGDGCQPNFGKCLSSVASCTGLPTATTTATAITGITTTTPSRLTDATLTARTTFTGPTTSTRTQTPQTTTSTRSTRATTQTLSPGATTTRSRSTATVSIQAPNVYDAIQAVVNGTISKEYRLDAALTQIDKFESIQAILRGTDTNFPNVTFFCSSDGGWGSFLARRRRFNEIAGRSRVPRDAGFVERRLAPRQTAKDHIDQVLLYNINPIFIDRRTLSPKVLAPTLLNGPTDLTVVSTQYIVLITTDSGVGFFPTYGVSNTTVIDTIVTTSGVLYVTRDVVVPPLIPRNTLEGAGLTQMKQFLENTTQPNQPNRDLRMMEVTDGYGLPDQPGLTIFAPINDGFFDISEAISAFTADEVGAMLNYHQVISGNGVYYSSDFTDGMQLQTVQGDSLTINIQDGTVFVDGVQVLLLDVLTDSGVIHVINSVLLPPSLAGRATAPPKFQKSNNVVVADRISGLVPIARKLEPGHYDAPAAEDTRDGGQVDSGALAPEPERPAAGGDPMTDSGAVSSGGELYAVPDE
ncbi:hypothetical protein DFJ74DRAFT_703676 [Hyaloraphidium curvatum]|nr:hypothetical protein DFJ74DRAFT_703676 [Hyaloraphidium curvatum]